MKRTPINKEKLNDGDNIIVIENHNDKMLAMKYVIHEIHDSIDGKTYKQFVPNYKWPEFNSIAEESSYAALLIKLQIMNIDLTKLFCVDTIYNGKVKNSF